MRYIYGPSTFNDYLGVKLGYYSAANYNSLSYAGIKESIDDRLCVQSAPMVESKTDDTVIVQQETVEFSDETMVEDRGYETPLNPNGLVDQINTADLSTFLSRPVRISSFTWLESDNSDLVLQAINPWFLFFNDTRIKYKLNNFAFIKCDLKVKVMINASPFYYGCLAMTYQPLPNLTPSTIINTGGQQTLIPYSQRPISYIYPHESKGAEMTLPFFLHKNWLDINTAQDFTDMGRLSFSTFTTLRSANAVTGTGVTVQIYAWAENVELSGSTLSLSLQSKPLAEDEYGNGPISGPASTVARMAKSMRTLPVIGKFATATEIGAKAVSGIASLFGFTNVPMIDNIIPYQPRAFGSLAGTEICFPNEKLTLLAKNELSIDPSIVGAPAGDPLAIDTFVKHESFILRTTWNTTNLVNDILFYSRVHPYMFSITSNSNNSVVDYTPMAIPTQLFDGWRGDIIFRFKIIASKYHKGRLLIAFDPQGDVTSNVVNQPLTSSAIYTQIVDLGADDDVEIVVPYNQALPFLRTEIANNLANIPFTSSSTPTWNVVENRDNGAIIVRVLTTLTAPVLTAPVNILCYVRAGDNMEFGNPRKPLQTTSSFIVQSHAVYEDGQSTKNMGGVGAMTLPNQMRVNYGEVIKSLRVLLHRSNHIYTQGSPVASVGGYTKLFSVFGKLPPYYGFDPNGINIANQVIGAGTGRFNFTKNTPITLILPCFVGYRGSTIWTFNVAGVDSSKSIRVCRDPSVNMSWVDNFTAYSPPTTGSTMAQRDLVTTLSTVGGCAVTNQLTQAGLSVLCPNYNLFKFNSTNPANATLAPIAGSAQDGSADDTFRLEVTNNKGDNSNLSFVEKYWQAGPDFQPLFFLNVPSQFNLLTIPNTP